MFTMDDTQRLSRALNRIKLPPPDVSCGAEIVWFQHQYYRLDGRRMNRSPHRHTFYEVHFPLRGNAVYRTDDGRELTVTEGTYLFIPPRTEHTLVRCDDEHEKYSFAFSVSETEGDTSLLSFPSTVALLPAVPALYSAFALAEELVRRSEGKTPCFLRDALMPSVLLLASSVRTAGAEPRDREDVRLARAKSYVEDNRMCALCVEEVAAFVHLSKRQLDRLFERTESITTAVYIRRARCEAAKELLLETSLTLSEIADRLGFSNEYNFIRFFKQTEGFTPGEFRRAVNVAPTPRGGCGTQRP